MFRMLCAATTISKTTSLLQSAQQSMAIAALSLWLAHSADAVPKSSNTVPSVTAAYHDGLFIASPIDEKRSAPEATSTGADDDWIPAELIQARDNDAKTAYSGLVSCFKAAQPAWPATQVTKDQGDQCIQQNHAKRDGLLLSRQDSAEAPTDGDDRLSTVCSSANIVLSNFLTDGDLASNGKATKLAGQICDQTVAAAQDNLQPWGTSLLVQAGHKKGLSIVHNNRKLRMLTTIANYAFDLATPAIKSRVVNMCQETLIDLAKTCTTDLRYGASGNQLDHVAKALTGFWRNGTDALQVMFDFSMDMP